MLLNLAAPCPVVSSPTTPKSTKLYSSCLNLSNSFVSQKFTGVAISTNVFPASNFLVFSSICGGALLVTIPVSILYSNLPLPPTLFSSLTMD